MHIIHLHIGDFQDATKRYEPEAVGIYILLLFEYYKTEKPLPADMEELEFLCGVRTKSERASLRFVLKRCFVLSEDGQTYAHKRCDREIENYRANCIQNRYAILCRHWEKVNPGTQRPSYDEFAANVSRYYDDSTKRIRVLTARKTPESPPNPAGNTAALPTGYPPVTSNQEPVTSNQENTPQVPKGTCVSSSVSESDGADGNQEPLGELLGELLGETIPARSDQPAKPKKKKGDAAREGSVEMPESWSDARRGIVGTWLAHRLSKGKLITPEQFAALIASTEALSDGQLQACVDEAIHRRGELEPHKFVDASRDLFRAGSWCEEIYDAYPRKEKKPTALKAIERAMRVAQIAPQELLKRVQIYAVAVAKWGASRYTADGRDTVPHPATWFNAHQFNDDASNWERRPAGGDAAQKKEGGVPNNPPQAYEITARAPSMDSEPARYREAWAALYKFECPAWAACPESNRADVREWIATNPPQA